MKRTIEQRIPSFLQTCLFFLLFSFLCIHDVHCIQVPLSQSNHHHHHHHHQTPTQVTHPLLSGDWQSSRDALRKQNCCVVSIPGLEHHMMALYKVFVNEGPANIDLRARVRVQAVDVQQQEQQQEQQQQEEEQQEQLQSAECQNTVIDCSNIRQSVVPISKNPEDTLSIMDYDDACTHALVELARGVASLAEGPLEHTCKHVFIRIVCASDYKAIDPPYHTDKAPLRGYVTLVGLGTEYVHRTCSPMEYAMLRMFGKGVPEKDVQKAKELEFIVMKGDYYAYEDPNLSLLDSLMNKIWQRNKACIHRSPPALEEGGVGSRRRVIVSLDLDDGLDDREWYEINKSREWRLGMTQRKSKLVA